MDGLSKPFTLSDSNVINARAFDVAGNQSTVTSASVNTSFTFLNDMFETGLPVPVPGNGLSNSYFSGTVAGWIAGSPNSITVYNAADGKNNSYYIYTKDNSKVLSSPINKNGTYFDVRCKLTGYQAPYTGGHMILYDSANSVIFQMANPHCTYQHWLYGMMCRKKLIHKHQPQAECRH